MVAVLVMLVAPAAGNTVGVGKAGSVGSVGVPITFPPAGAGPV